MIKFPIIFLKANVKSEHHLWEPVISPVHDQLFTEKIGLVFQSPPPKIDKSLIRSAKTL